MAVERTLSIIKPDAVARGAVGGVLAVFEKAGLRPIAIRMLQLSEGQARGFYAVHKERPFFGSLVKFMTSGPIVVSVLEGEGAIARNRELMGATDPAKAAPGTLRALFGSDVERNAVHGSDSPATARIEIAYFFDATQIQGTVEALP
jgi:nucleoside-diphosphate kinase